MYFKNKFFDIDYEEKLIGESYETLKKLTDILNDKRDHMKYSQQVSIADQIEDLYDLTIQGFMSVKLEPVKKIKNNKDVIEYIDLTNEAIEKAKELREQITKSNKKENKND